MIKQLAHICIHTKSLSKTAVFYCDGLGMERYFEFEKEGEPFGYYLKAGNATYIEVFKGDPEQVGNIHHLALEVENMDGMIIRLRDQGIEVGDKVFGADDSWQAWLEDPNGVKIELHEYTESSCQLTRRTCLVNW